MARFFLLCLLAACGSREPASFEGHDDAWWSAALEESARRPEAHDKLMNGGAAAIPVLRALLAGEAQLPSVIAADLLGALGPRADVAVPDLKAALRRKELRGIAATALGRIGRAARPALERLRELWDDRDMRVRVAAAGACWLIVQDEDAIDVLLLSLDAGNPAVRQMAVESLGRIGKPAVDALIRALSHEDPRVRAAAADSLGAIGPDARLARKALYAALKDESEIVRRAAEAALERLRD